MLDVCVGSPRRGHTSEKRVWCVRRGPVLRAVQVSRCSLWGPGCGWGPRVARCRRPVRCTAPLADVAGACFADLTREKADAPFLSWSTLEASLSWPPVGFSRKLQAGSTPRHLVGPGEAGRLTH